ncbi:hypothetical protein EJ08DRAFT_732512 [Tothia fuscella]|uniref:Large ribosomal subunit protein mL43 n=1 Tax=Tothia fuscella TaxID=1048955 RepID=A0A9P4NUE6_9PEZI|nr:hypothetical protein EJ08DRAFT_732512 [Tothia fuscella]
MPLTALKAVAKSQNGIGAHILQCKRLDFHYCDWAGSSRGMLTFLKHTLPRLALSNPSIEITVSPRPHKHPLIKGHYMNGRTRDICVRNLEKEEILAKVEILRLAGGEKLRSVKKPVGSANESVRGIWSGLHGQGIRVGGSVGDLGARARR